MGHTVHHINSYLAEYLIKKGETCVHQEFKPTNRYIRLRFFRRDNIKGLGVLQYFMTIDRGRLKENITESSKDCTTRYFRII